MSAHFRITSVDYAPDDLPAQVPIEGTLLRRIPGPDRPDYWLAQLLEPVSWIDNGVGRSVTHLILAARYEGQTIREESEELVVGIAYVVDSSLLEDMRIDFAKCRYVAIGEMDFVRGV